MSQGISVKLPMSLHPGDGYTLNKSYSESVRQNLKMLVLTAPGERMMDPLFGVGLRNFLFEQNHPITLGTIESKIRRQVAKYMPFVEIIDIDFGQLDDGSPLMQNSITISLVYKIVPLSIVDKLMLELDGNRNDMG